MAETLDEEKARVYGEAGLERLRAEQKAKLLPQLEQKKFLLVVKRQKLDASIDEIHQAMDNIHAGRITAYALRRQKQKTG